MSILITGAAGFIGRHLAAALLADGHRVVGVDSFITSDPPDLEPLLAERKFEFHEMDVREPAFRDLAAALVAEEGVEEIYHLACPTGVPNLGPLALEMLETSFDGTRAVLDAALGGRSRVVLASSAEVYGNPLVSPQAEEYAGNVDPLGPRKGYEEGKRVAETLCGIYAERYGVAAVIARIFNTYGPGMSLGETRVVPAFTRAAIRGEPLVVHGSGEQLRCHAYVADVVVGLRRAAERGAPGRAYNLGSQQPTSVRALAELIVRLTGSASPIEYRERPSHDHDARLPATERARSELGWAPATALEEGLQRTIADIAQRIGEWRMDERARGVAAHG